MEAWFIMVLSFLVLSGLIIKRSLQSIHQLPPGPQNLPIITDIFRLRISLSKLEPFLHKLHAKHGPMISFHFWSTPHIFINDRTLAHQALIQNGAVFADRPKTLSNKNTTGSDMLNITSSCYGPTWRVLRKNLASIMLHPSRLRSLSNTRIRKRVLENLLNQLKSNSQSNNRSVKVINHIQHAIFCLLVFMCFGETVDSKKIQDIKIMQSRLISNSGKFGALNFFPKAVSRVLFRKRWEKLLHLMKSQRDVMVELIEARKKAAIENESSTVICYVDTLLNVQLPEQKRKLDEGELVALCSEFLTAGTDTTSTALEWVMANLVKHTNVQQRLVEEIEEVMGDTDREQREVKEEDLERLTYLKAVILEGLRRHPPSHFLIPHAVTEDVVLNGYLVPKKGTVNFMVPGFGWDPMVWEDPMEFKPERFFRENEKNASGLFEEVDITGKKEIKMIPFGAGRRICPAYNLAMLHLEYFVANLVWNFEWKTSPAGYVDLSGKQEFTMVMKHPLQAQISTRI